MNQDIIRSIAQQATQVCFKESLEDKTAPAWRYEDAVVRIVLKDCINLITKEYLSMSVESDWEDGRMCGLVYANMLLMERFGIDEMPYE